MHTVVSCLSPECPNSHDAAEPVLCGNCVRRVDQHLRRLPVLYRELEDSLSGSRPANRSDRHGSGGVATGIPLNGQAVEARAAVRDVLASWARLAVDDLRMPAPQVEVTALSVFLRTHLDRLRAHPACGDLADEIAGLVSTATRVAYSSGMRSIRVGDCVYDDCPGHLVAVVRSNERALPSEVRCTADSQHSWSTRQWTTLSERMGRSA